MAAATIGVALGKLWNLVDISPEIFTGIFQSFTTTIWPVISSLAANPLFSLSAFILAGTVHEFAHALTQDLFGDDLPRKQGRLSLNPVRHIRLTSIQGLPLPAIKPVIYGSNKPYLAAILAGPIINLILAFIGYAATGLSPPGTLLATYLNLFTQANLLVGVINLLTGDGLLILGITLSQVSSLAWLRPIALTMEGEKTPPQEPSPQLVNAIKDFTNARWDLFQSLLELNENEFISARNKLLASARQSRLFSHDKQTLSQTIAQLVSKGDLQPTILRHSEFGEISLPVPSVTEILHFGGAEEPLTQEMRQSLETQFNFVIDAFPVMEQDRVRQFKNDLEIVSISGETLLDDERFKTAITMVKKIPGEERKIVLAKLLESLASVFDNANEPKFPDITNINRPNPRIVLKPREDTTLLNIVFTHELFHALALLKVLDVPATIEILTETVTAVEIARTLGTDKKDFDYAGKTGRQVLFEAGKQWIRKNSAQTIVPSPLPSPPWGRG